jgi:hypothetical protein
VLHEFIARNRAEIIDRCRAKAPARALPAPPETAIDHGVPMFLDQLVDAFQRGVVPHPDTVPTAAQHGQDLLRRGCSLSVVVHTYGDICQAITELAVHQRTAIPTDDFRVLNRSLDDAIAGAVTQYGRDRDQSLDRIAARASERVEMLTADLGVCVETARVAFEAIKAGAVGSAGSTAFLLERSLSMAADLKDRLLTLIQLPVRRTDAD